MGVALQRVRKSLNVQQLKHFVAVAEELHFGRAAERIGISQPPLSQSIRRLEAALNCELFYRTRRRVELTSSGEALLEHARAIISQVEYIKHSIHRAGETIISSVRIGYSSNALSDHVPAAIRRIKEHAPFASITLVETRTPDQIEALTNGELDIGFFYPETPKIHRLEVRVLARPRVVAAIPEGWPLAQKSELRLRDLRDVPLITQPASAHPAYHAAVVSAFQHAGVTPLISQEAFFSFTRLRLAAAGLGVALISEVTAPRGHLGTVQRQIVDMPPHILSELVMAWRSSVATSVSRIYASAFDAAKNV